MTPKLRLLFVMAAIASTICLSLDLVSLANDQCCPLSPPDDSCCECFPDPMFDGFVRQAPPKVTIVDTGGGAYSVLAKCATYETSGAVYTGTCPCPHQVSYEVGWAQELVSWKECVTVDLIIGPCIPPDPPGTQPGPGAGTATVLAQGYLGSCSTVWDFDNLVDPPKCPWYPAASNQTTINVCDDRAFPSYIDAPERLVTGLSIQNMRIRMISLDYGFKTQILYQCLPASIWYKALASDQHYAAVWKTNAANECDWRVRLDSVFAGQAQADSLFAPPDDDSCMDNIKVLDCCDRDIGPCNISARAFILPTAAWVNGPCP